LATVEVRNLTKQFGDNPPAVDAIDLASKDGEFLVLLGPSGCGKTTLLRMIGGLEPPTAGDVYIGGRLVNGLPPRARQIAMVFQSYALYPHMSVANNIAFPLKAQKVSREEQKKKIEWAASILPSRTSTPNAAPRPATSCNSSNAGSARPPSTLPTIKSRRWAWGTESP
jgi:multiple sugar transport system ATP-binding protein